MKPVKIIGGGLAGLSLGICLRHKGIPVQLHEKGSYPRHKVCGEFISGVSRETLESLGILDQLSDALMHSDISWWMGDDELLTKRLPSPAMGISRFRLDQRLADEFVRLGGELCTASRVKTESSPRDGTVIAGGKLPQKKSDDLPDWIGLKIHAIDAEIAGLQMHSASRSGKGGYLGLCQVEDNRVNCCGLFHLRPEIKPSEAKARWQSPAAMIMAYAEDCGMGALVDVMKRWHYDEASASSTAGFQLGEQKQTGNFCIGDASSLIPPFTGNGMSMALESSAMAADWIERYSDGTVNWQEAIEGYSEQSREHFSRRLHLSQSLHPMLFNRIGQVTLKTAAKLHLLPFKMMFEIFRKP